MKKLLLFLMVLLCCKSSVFASHIVGGEFELLHESDFIYRLNLILYFDDDNGLPGARDPQVQVHFFRKSDNRLVRTLILNQNSDAPVAYSNPSCDPNNEIINTSRILYTNTIFLDPNTYDDPEGYYVSWERCCRNYTISNIESNDPNIPGSGISAGQTFYLEFPPVMKDGVQYINSSPRLFPPLRDYGCVNKPYFTDFGGVDDDGDSLVYSLVTPYSTVDTQNAIPEFPSPGPYPDVVWQPGFSLEKIVQGRPDLTITTNGLLRVTPGLTGLFVFAVKVEEYRDGVKHGEMRRDFQMKVIDGCAANNDPQIFAREEGQKDFYQEGGLVSFNFNDDEKCVEVLVVDNPIGEDFERVQVRAIPINFNADAEGIEIIDTQNLLIANELDTARFRVCFPDCPPQRSGFYQIGLIGFDDACPQPSLDTVIVSLNVPPPPNSNAFFQVDNVTRSGNASVGPVIYSADGTATWDIGAFDINQDLVDFNITPLGFSLEDVGMELTPIETGEGFSTTELTWNYDCNALGLDFSAGRDVPVANGVRKAFDFLLQAEDQDQCEWPNPQTMTLSVLIDFPDQTKPEVFDLQRPGEDEISFNYRLLQSIDRTIRAVDEDGDEIILEGRGVNFNFEDYDVLFSNIQGEGPLNSHLLWDLICSIDLAVQDSFRAEFIVEDIDECALTNADKLTIDIKLEPPVNNDPTLTVISRNELNLFDEDSIGVFIGQELNLRIVGQDLDGDELTLRQINGEEIPGELRVDEASGTSRIIQDIVWTPDCSIFTDENLTETFELLFTLSDNSCFESSVITRLITVTIKDVTSGPFSEAPPNFISPNDDSFNPFFGMYRKLANGSLQNLLPPDNCVRQFEAVHIYNRWGREVYSSTNRDFMWYAEDVAPGVYYYVVKFGNDDIKGALTVMR